MLPYMIFHLWIAGDINILAYGLCITIPSYAERRGDLQPPALPHRLSPLAARWLATAPAGGCRTVPQPRGQQRGQQVDVTWDFWGLCTQQANRWAERAIAEAFTAL